MASVETWQERVDHELYGNGQPGLISDVRTFLAESKGQHKTWNNIGMLIGTVASIAVIVDLIIHVVSKVH